MYTLIIKIHAKVTKVVDYSDHWHWCAIGGADSIGGYIELFLFTASEMEKMTIFRINFKSQAVQGGDELLNPPLHHGGLRAQE